MNKKLMAVAVAGALGAPAAAFAQASNIQIYGRVNVGLDQYTATGATNQTTPSQDFQSRTRVFDNASRLGVRGTEDLGGGMKAFFVIETGANVDSGGLNGQNGVANASSGVFASRDSYMGLGGNWGDVRFGRQAIWYTNGEIVQIGTNYINAEISSLNGAQLGRAAGPATRQSNVVSYNSPTVAGFSGTGYYAPNSEASTQGQPTNGRIMGITLRYSGPVKVQFDHGLNQAQDVTVGAVTTTGLKITGDKLGVAFAYMPGGQIGVVATRDRNAGLTAAVAGFANVGDTIEQRAVNVVWEHLFGNFQAMAAYGKVNSAKGCSVVNGCDSTGSKEFVVGGRYLMSKRTAVYVSYNKITNDSNAVADISGAGQSSAVPGAAPNTGALVNTSAGADPRIIAVGIIHNF